jgi:tRNA-5-taurinomethyluridine 2-sulfurtransferase
MLNIDEIKDKRIAVLLSGGVDSSVVVWEFAQLGLHPDCFYIKIGPEEKEEWDCSSEEDLEMATAVARKYGCKLQVVDCHHEYWNEVTRYTMEKVKAGFTPNPDVMCNRLIKFGAFDEKMGHNYDLIATGHYAQTETDENGDKWLVTSPDPVKDQTDFLAQIESWQLKKAIFPIGHHIKNEVREIAEEEHLINAKRKDSQGICFLGQINYNDYIRRYLGEKPGDVIEMETGKRIGEHKGLWFHTIGQRKGLGFGGGPWFVIKKDVENNILYVSHGYDPQSAYKKVTWSTSLAILLAVSGVGLLYQGDGNDKLSTAGFALVMCSSLLYALYIISINQWKNPGMSNIKFTFYILVFGLITMLIYSFIAGEPIQMLQTPKQWLCAAQLALLPTVLSLFFMTVSINLIGSTPAAIMGALEPVTAVIIGVCVFGESFSLQLAIGILAILAGVTIIIARKKG